MNVNKRNKARLLSASSLALAAILTMGAGSAWAQNTTVQDNGPVSGGTPNTPIIIVDAPGATATVNGGTGEGSVLEATGSQVNTIAMIGGADITLTGTGGNLVENTGTQKAINLSLNASTLTVQGKGGVLANVTGNVGTESTNLLQVEGTAADKTKVSIGDISNITLLVDPAIVNVGTVNNSNVGVGFQSVVVMGVNDAVDQAFADRVAQNINWGAVGAPTAILGVTSPQTLGTGNKYLVDGQYTTVGDLNTAIGAAPGGLTFGANSAFIVDLGNLEGRAAITAQDNTATANIDATSRLYVTGAKATNYAATGAAIAGAAPAKVLEGFGGGITDNGWSANLTSDSFDTRLFTGGRLVEDTAGTYNLYADYQAAATAYSDGKISKGMAQGIDGVYLSQLNDVNSTDAGVRFVSRATSSLFLDTDQNNGKKVVETLEGAAAMGALAGVHTASYSISNTVADQYNSRLSYLRDTAPAAGSEPGSTAVWINPFYHFADLDGVGLGRHTAEYEINYGGATIGVDTNLTENYRMGLAVSVGGGDTESKGGRFNKTDSDFDFWGVGIYGSYTDGMFGLSGDVGYTRASFDIDQRTPISNKLTADVDTDAITVGLTGEWRYLTENCLNIIPHIGVRYTHLETDSYRVKEKGNGTAFRVSSEKQNIWTFPVGVTFTGDVDTASGWTIKPKADIGVIFAAGDVDADSKYRIGETGFGGKITADDVVDAVTFNGVLGLKADAGTGFSVGLDYNLKASDNLISHGVTGMIRYEF